MSIAKQHTPNLDRLRAELEALNLDSSGKISDLEKRLHRYHKKQQRLLSKTTQPLKKSYVFDYYNNLYHI